VSSQSLGKKARAALDLAQDLKLDSALPSAKTIVSWFSIPRIQCCKIQIYPTSPTNLSTAKVDVENTKKHL